MEVSSISLFVGARLLLVKRAGDDDFVEDDEDDEAEDDEDEEEDEEEGFPFLFLPPEVDETEGGVDTTVGLTTPFFFCCALLGGINAK